MSCNVYLTLSFASDTRSSRVLRSASVTKSTSRSKPDRLAPGTFRQHTNNRPQIEVQAHPQLEPTDHTADLMPDIPPKADYDRFLEVAVQAAQAAGQLIEQAFTKDKDVEFKGTMDLVTATDKQCEETILAAITEAFPDHKFIGEEGSSAQGFTSSLSDNPTWMVDPLDGTTNFVHRFPFVCTSIALVIQKEIVVGVVYNPVLKEMFTAVKGKGAFLNDQPTQVSEKDKLEQALLATEIGVSRDDEVMDAIFSRIRNVTARMRSIRCAGACALNLCSVACGRIDVMYEVGFGGCWDCAAGALIVTEAGGQMLDPSGGPFNVMARRVLGSNAHLGKPVADIIASCKSSSKEPQPLK